MKYLCLIIFAAFAVTGCNQQPPDYQEKLNAELASGEKNNDLFLGFYLGMPRQAFYDTCWQLNKEGKAKHGTANSSVAYPLPAGTLDQPATMEFYPEFYRDSISEMLTEYKYDAWAPWNKDLSAEVLVKDVYRYLKKEHGDFFLTDLGEKGKALCNIDGNRRIIIRRTADDSKVQVVYNDMTNYAAAAAEKAARRAKADKKATPAWSTPGAGKR